MTDTLSTKVEQGTRPYSVVDLHGETVAEGLDDVPPLLNQEEIDRLAAHVTETVVFETAVADAVFKLPDSEGGVGDVHPGLDFGCQKCKEKISPSDDQLVTAFGYFYHERCISDE